MKFVSKQQVTPEHALLKWQVRGCWGVSDHSEDNMMLSVQSEKKYLVQTTWHSTVLTDKI